MHYDAIVIGGGLAGCSAAAHLSKEGFSVLLLEKSRFPRHKLCGEFLSPESMGLFDRVGVLQEVEAAGAERMSRVEVTTNSGASYHDELPGEALGLSRYRLDALLFAHAGRLGADAREGVPVSGVEGDLTTGFQVNAGGDTFRSRIVIGAYGRRALIDRKLERPFLQQKADRVAFKAHYTGYAIGPTIEVHAFRGGYCGLSPVEKGRVNACWIMDKWVLDRAGGSAERVVETAFAANPVLKDRFDHMTQETETLRAVSQITFMDKGKFDRDVCMIGDTAGMIAPLCGDGMSMALRSAEFGSDILASFLHGRLSRAEAIERYTKQWYAEFKQRILLGRLIHGGIVRPVVAGPVVRALDVLPGVGGWLVRSTRGDVSSVMA